MCKAEMYFLSSGSVSLWVCDRWDVCDSSKGTEKDDLERWWSNARNYGLASGAVMRARKPSKARKMSAKRE